MIDIKEQIESKRLSLRAFVETDKGNEMINNWCWTFEAVTPMPYLKKVISTMQEIGVKDCKGAIIYEGDIISNLSKGNTIYIVPRLRDCFIPSQIGYEIENNKNHTYKVIGNIYETPELLNTNNHE